MRKLFQTIPLLLISVMLAGCTAGLPEVVSRLPDSTASPSSARLIGNAARGEAIYRHGKEAAPPCLTCHALAPSTFGLGPIMIGISTRAATRIPGETATDYIRQSILHPLVYVVPGYRPIMYPGYSNALLEQDIADLIAYLLTL